MNIEIPKDYDFVSTLVSIHNVTSPLYEFNSGSFSISTGSWNYFQIERVFNQHLGEPYSSCLKDINSFKINKSHSGMFLIFLHVSLFKRCNVFTRF